MDWLLKILVAHRRLRGLTEAQLQDLISRANDVESLKIIKTHLESGSFRYGHIESKAAELIRQCSEKAKEIIWSEHVGEIKRAFFEKLGDPLAMAADHIHLFL